MQGYTWLYLIAYPIDYIIYAYNYIYGLSLFADGSYLTLYGNRVRKGEERERRTNMPPAVCHVPEAGDRDVASTLLLSANTAGNVS